MVSGFRLPGSLGFSNRLLDSKSRASFCVCPALKPASNYAIPLSLWSLSYWSPSPISCMFPINFCMRSGMSFRENCD